MPRSSSLAVSQSGVQNLTLPCELGQAQDSSFAGHASAWCCYVCFSRPAQVCSSLCNALSAKPVAEEAANLLAEEDHIGEGVYVRFECHGLV